MLMPTDSAAAKEPVWSWSNASPTPWQQAFTPFLDSMRLTVGDPVYVELMAPEQFELGTQFEPRVLGVADPLAAALG